MDPRASSSPAALQFKYQRRFRRKPLALGMKTPRGFSSSMIIIVLLFPFWLLWATVGGGGGAQAQLVAPSNLIGATKTPGNQFAVSQVCATRSLFPTTRKRVEGAVLWSSESDVDMNCTITFNTKSSQQHFVLHFERLKLGCDDHLRLYDADFDYGQRAFGDFSCASNLAGVPKMKTVGSHLTIRLTLDQNSIPGDGFRLVVAAVYDYPRWDCPLDHALCANNLCIARALFCDQVNHCIDGSDELACPTASSSLNQQDSANSDPAGQDFLGSLLAGGSLSLSNALGLLVILVLIIFTCVILFIATVYCRREPHTGALRNPLAGHPYQSHLQRTYAPAPLHASSSLMFGAGPPDQYHYFQPAPGGHLSHAYLAAAAAAAGQQANLAATASLPRGYTTLPLNQHHLMRGAQHLVEPAQEPQQKPEYLVMAGLSGAPHQPAAALHSSLYLPTSQSILVQAAPALAPAQQQQQQPVAKPHRL